LVIMVPITDFLVWRQRTCYLGVVKL